MLRPLLEEARLVGRSLVQQKQNRGRPTRVEILTVESFHDSVQSNSVPSRLPFRLPSTWLRSLTRWNQPWNCLA